MTKIVLWNLESFFTDLYALTPDQKCKRLALGITDNFDFMQMHRLKYVVDKSDKVLIIRALSYFNKYNVSSFGFSRILNQSIDLSKVLFTNVGYSSASMYSYGNDTNIKVFLDAASELEFNDVEEKQCQLLTLMLNSFNAWLNTKNINDVLFNITMKSESYTKRIEEKYGITLNSNTYKLLNSTELNKIMAFRNFLKNGVKPYTQNGRFKDRVSFYTRVNYSEKFIDGKIDWKMYSAGYYTLAFSCLMPFDCYCRMLDKSKMMDNVGYNASYLEDEATRMGFMSKLVKLSGKFEEQRHLFDIRPENFYYNMLNGIVDHKNIILRNIDPTAISLDCRREVDLRQLLITIYNRLDSLGYSKYLYGIYCKHKDIKLEMMRFDDKTVPQVCDIAKIVNTSGFVDAFDDEAVKQLFSEISLG